MLQLIQPPIEALAKLAGLPVDPLKIILCLLLSYPLSGLLKRLPDRSPLLKNLFVIGVGLFFLIGVFDLWGGIRTILISGLGTWVLCRYVQGPIMPWINFFFIMGHMSINQIHRQRFGNPDIVDITGAQMVLVMKLTAFAWNVHDGRLARRAQGGVASLAEFQQESVLVEMPDPVSYIAWIMFFPSLLIGPAFEYAQYRAWLNCSLYNVKPKANSKAAKKMSNGRKIPRSGTAATKRAAEGFFWLFCYTMLASRFNVDYVLSDEFTTRSLLYRFLYIMPLAFTHRSMYYGVWKLSEGACILAGFGFNGFTASGSIDWSSIENISPYEFETAQNTKALLEAWNKNTNKWLKNYIYLRVTPKGKKPGLRSTICTFATSAIWHGFYPGYYFAFATGAMAQTIGKQYRRFLRPFFLEADLKTPASNKWIYDVICWSVTQFSWAYIVQPFVVLSLSGSFLFWRRYYFVLHVAMGLNYLFFNTAASASLKRSLKQKVKRAESLKTKSTEVSSESGHHHVTTIPEASDATTKEILEMKGKTLAGIDSKNLQEEVSKLLGKEVST